MNTAHDRNVHATPDFAEEYDEHRRKLDDQLGYAPTREQVMRSMMLDGWEFEDSSGKISLDDEDMQ